MMNQGKYIFKKFWYIFFIHILILYFVSHFWLGSEEQWLEELKYPNIVSFFLARITVCLIISILLIIKLLIIVRIFSKTEISYILLSSKLLLIYVLISFIFVLEAVLFP